MSTAKMAETITVQIDCGGCYRLPRYEVSIHSPFPLHLLIVDQQPVPGTLLQAGVHNITITVTDPVGNVHVCEKTLHVECATTYYNTEQTAECDDGETGDSVTIEAGQYSSTVSQADADAQALAAAEAQLQCCADTSASIAGNLNSAVYDSVRDVIWGTGTPGHILKFNSDTGDLISTTFVFGPDWGNDATIAYCPETDRLYTSSRISYSANPTNDYKLYEIHPDTLVITNSINLGAIDDWDGNGGGIQRLYSANGFLYGIAYDVVSDDTDFFVIDPTTVFPNAPSGSYWTRNLSTVGTFGDAAFENRLDPIFVTSYNFDWGSDSSVNARFAATTVGGGFLGFLDLLAVDVPVYGICYCNWNQYYYNTKATRYVGRHKRDCAGETIIDLGRPNADPYNIRFNDYNNYIYVPCWSDNTVAIISPSDDSVVIVTGFDSPYDVVFTPTKAFAVQHSRQGLKVITATLPTLADPDPEPPDPAMVKRLLSYYDFEETSPPWLDSKGTNHLVPGVGRLNGNVHALAIDGSSKIMVGGTFTTIDGASRTRIARINSSGLVGIDTTFTPAAAPGTVRALAVQADTKILAGGDTSNRLIRLSATGATDGTFTPVPNNSVRALAIQSGDQKVIVGGTFTSIAGRSIRGLTRLKTDGTDDTAWNASSGGVNGNTLLTAGTGYTSASGVATTGGTGTGATFDIFDDGGGGVSFVILNNPGSGYTAGDVLTLVGGGNDATVQVDSLTAAGTGLVNNSVFACAIDGSGNIVIGGNFTGYNDSNGTTSINRIARILATGKLDTSFNPGTGANGNVNALAIDGSGNIIIGGDFTSVNGVTHNRLARLDSSGNLDASFTPSFSSSVSSIVIQADGKIVVGTTSLVRLNSDGTTDTSTAIGTILALALQSDQKIVVGYTLVSFNALKRVTTALAIETDFNPSLGANSVAGLNGNALAFNFVDSTASIQNLASTIYLDPRKGWTVTYWLKTTANGLFAATGLQISQFLYEFLNAIAGSSCAFAFSMDMNTAFYSDGTYLSGSGGSLAPTLNVNYFLRIWVDPTDRKLRFQATPSTAGTLNGTIQASNFGYDRVKTFDASQLIISQGGASGSSRTAFVIEGLAIYEGALSDADAAINYGGGTPPAYAGIYNP